MQDPANGLTRWRRRRTSMRRHCLSRPTCRPPCGVNANCSLPFALCFYPHSFGEPTSLWWLGAYRHRRPLLGVLGSPRGYLLSVAPQVRARSERTQDVVGARDQKLPHHLVALLGDVFLTGVPLPRAVGGWHETQVSPHPATLLEAVGILQGEHEGQRRERPYPLHLAQEPRLGVMLFGDRIKLSVVSTDALGERADLLQDGPQSRTKRLGDVLGRSLVEAPCGAFGQASPEGLDRSAERG